MEIAAQQQDEESLSSVVIPLCKGMVDQQYAPLVWQKLLKVQLAVADYVSVLGLKLIVDEVQGYAFLRSCEQDLKSEKLPRLIRRQPLNFHVSLLLALLRERITESEVSGDEVRVLVSRDEVVEMLRIFLPDGSNEVRLTDQVDTHINQIIKMGFARRLKGQEKIIELHRIIKSFIDAQWLLEFDERLAEYQQLLVKKEG